MTVARTAEAPGRMRARSAAVLGLVTIVGIAGFIWPLVARSSSILVSGGGATWLFAALLPLLLALVLTEMADGGLDSRGIAMLGVLAAAAAALRPFGAGAVGFEPMWVVIILGGRALGPGFGFLLGNISLFASALLTGGIGPWLPFQMLAAGWLGFAAGCLPPVRGKLEPVMLSAFGAVASLVYGLLLNLWFWPWGAGPGSQLAYLPGAPLTENLHRWFLFSVATSLGYDIPRAIVVGGLVLVTAAPVLAVLRRATRRASFGRAIAFEAAE